MNVPFNDNDPALLNLFSNLKNFFSLISFSFTTFFPFQDGLFYNTHISYPCVLSLLHIFAELEKAFRSLLASL